MKLKSNVTTEDLFSTVGAAYVDRFLNAYVSVAHGKRNHINMLGSGYPICGDMNSMTYATGKTEHTYFCTRCFEMAMEQGFKTIPVWAIPEKEERFHRLMDLELIPAVTSEKVRLRSIDDYHDGYFGDADAEVDVFGKCGFGSLTEMMKNSLFATGVRLDGVGHVSLDLPVKITSNVPLEVGVATWIEGGIKFAIWIRLEKSICYINVERSRIDDWHKGWHGYITERLQDVIGWRNYL